MGEAEPEAVHPEGSSLAAPHWYLNETGEILVKYLDWEAHLGRTVTFFPIRLA